MKSNMSAFRWLVTTVFIANQIAGGAVIPAVYAYDDYTYPEENSPTPAIAYDHTEDYMAETESAEPAKDFYDDTTDAAFIDESGTPTDDGGPSAATPDNIEIAHADDTPLAEEVADNSTASDSGSEYPAAAEPHHNNEPADNSSEEVSFVENTMTEKTRQELQEAIDRYDSLIESYRNGNAEDQATLDNLTDQISQIDQTRTDLETQFNSYGNRNDEEAQNARRALYQQIQDLLDQRSPLNIRSNTTRMRMQQRDIEIQDCERKKQALLDQLNGISL